MVDNLNPKLKEVWGALKDRYSAANPGKSLILTCTYRSPEEQLRLYTQGRQQVAGKWVITEPNKVVTYCDGYKIRSLHNSHPSRALDFAVLIGGKVSWDPKEYAEPGRIAEELGVEWGGNWKSFKDYPHIQLRKES